MNAPEHPTVQHWRLRQAAAEPAAPWNAERLKQLVIQAGADDVGLVEIQRPELDDQRDDILAAFTNFSGPGSFGRTRAQGDVEGNPDGNTPTTPDPADGDVDVSDIITMFGNFTGPLDEGGGLGGPAEAGDPNPTDVTTTTPPTLTQFSATVPR